VVTSSGYRGEDVCSTFLTVNGGMPNRHIDLKASDLKYRMGWVVGIKRIVQIRVSNDLTLVKTRAFAGSWRRELMNRLTKTEPTVV
jgi:hypothetical protein